MRYSSFNWTVRGKRGWIFGPFFRRTLTITFERHDPEADQFLADEAHIDQLAERMGWNRNPNYIPLYAERRCAVCGNWRGQHIGESGNDNEMKCPVDTSWFGTVATFVSKP